MHIIRSPQAMQQWSMETRKQGKRIGLVPTMGYLHEGHLSLVDLCHARADRTVLSLYVNPTQFAPTEDLDAYPRDFSRDCELAEKRGCKVLFAPSSEDIYLAGHHTSVEVESLTQNLCGQSRPTHFKGVTTIVAKLFHIVLPHVAAFGQKDAQQLAIIRRMVRDLNMPVEILAGEIIREPDGLAMSSRNAYLSTEQRKEAVVLHASLHKAKATYDAGQRDATALEELVRSEISKSPQARIDYVSVVDRNEITPLQKMGKAEALLAVAVFFGKTRLIDNLVM